MGKNGERGCHNLIPLPNENIVRGKISRFHAFRFHEMINMYNFRGYSSNCALTWKDNSFLFACLMTDSLNSKPSGLFIQHLTRSDKELQISKFIVPILGLQGNKQQPKLLLMISNPKSRLFVSSDSKLLLFLSYTWNSYLFLVYKINLRPLYFLQHREIPCVQLRLIT